jgi:hypothetical protein
MDAHTCLSACTTKWHASSCRARPALDVSSVSSAGFRWHVYSTAKNLICLRGYRAGSMWISLALSPAHVKNRLASLARVSLLNAHACLDCRCDHVLDPTPNNTPVTFWEPFWAPRWRCSKTPKCSTLTIPCYGEKNQKIMGCKEPILHRIVIICLLAT